MAHYNKFQYFLVWILMAYVVTVRSQEEEGSIGGGGGNIPRPTTRNYDNTMKTTGIVRKTTTGFTVPTLPKTSYVPLKTSPAPLEPRRTSKATPVTTPKSTTKMSTKGIVLPTRFVPRATTLNGNTDPPTPRLPPSQSNTASPTPAGQTTKVPGGPTGNPPRDPPGATPTPKPTDSAAHTTSPVSISVLLVSLLLVISHSYA